MRKNLEFAAAVLATFFVISCASTPKPEDTSSKSELAAAQLPDGEYDKSSAKNPEENQTDENAPENSDETPQEKNQNSNPTEKADGKNISKIESSEDIGNQNLSQNPPKVQTAPAPRQPNPEPAKKSARGNQNQIPEENSENQKNEDDAKEIPFPDEKKSDKNQDDVPAEKINENDLISELKNEDAPTADEKNKVSEPSVSDFFEEPEVVEAGPEEKEEKNEEIQDSPMENEAVSTQNPAENQKSWPDEIKTETENNPPKQAEENTETAADSASSSENQETEKNEKAGTKTEEIVPSRSVTIKQNQYLDVVYPGNGWIYLGENEISRLRYFGRKTENGATAFSFRSIGADNTGSTRNTAGGNSILHFYKNDALTGKYIDDYLEVIVTDETAEKTERTTAPSYAEIVPPRLERRKAENQEISLSKPVSKEPDENASHPEDFSSPAGKNQNNRAALNSDFSPAREISSNDSLKTVISNSDSAQNQPGKFYTQNSYLNSNSNIEAEPEVQVSEQSPEDEAAQTDFADGPALEKARQLFDEKKYSESLENVQNFINGATKRLDEAYYLLGQLYESNSSIKNIKKAVDAYETVTRDFPLSKLWKNASERSIYLKRFYIDIR